jgi:hypothetical protein
MIPKPLHNAANILKTLASSECQVHIEENALVIHDPKKLLTEELRNQVQRHKLSILALLMREALLHLVQVLDMSQPDIPVGMQEEYASALLAAMRLVGNTWAENDKGMDFWKDEIA